MKKEKKKRNNQATVNLQREIKVNFVTPEKEKKFCINSQDIQNGNM